MNHREISGTSSNRNESELKIKESHVSKFPYGLNCFQINDILRSDQFTRLYYGGYFPVNGLPKGRVPWPSAFVSSTRPFPSINDNHAVVLYITPDGEGEYFNSLGSPPEHPQMVDFIRRNTVRTIFNDTQIQGVKPVCGHYAIYFLLQRCRGFHPNYIVRNFCPDAELNDEYVENFIHTVMVKSAPLSM